MVGIAVGGVGLGRRRGDIARFVGGLDGVNTDGAVEECGREEIGVARAPLYLERPVVCRGKLRGKLKKRNCISFDARTSPIISDVCGFQQRARLSLPHDNSKSESCLHHESDRTPFSWPVKI